MTYHHNHRLEGCEWCDDRHSLWGAFFLGLGVLAVGVILILDNFGVLDASVIAPYWPLLLVVVGVSRLIHPTSVRKIGCGLTWIAVGAIILAINFGLVAVGVGELWPLVLLIVGAHLLLRGARRHGHGEGGDTERESGATR